MAQYRVTGAVAVVRGENKSERYLYRGAEFSGEGLDAENVKHLIAIKLIEAVEGSAEEETLDEGSYKGVSVKDLKAALAARNEGREGDAKITPAEPGNRPEIVAALLADDAAQQ